MKKFLSIVTSGTLALLMATTSVVTSFAYDGNDESAKATDAVSLEVVSDNTIPAEEPTGPNETVPTVPCEPTINYPQISGFSNTSTGTKISWNSYSGAVKYRVYVFNGKSWSRVGECTATNFTHNSLRDGVTYRYTVRAMDKNNKFVSDYNKDGYSNTFFAPPVISSLQNVFGGVTVKWSKNSAIDSYRIYRKTKNTGWKRIGNSDNGSFTDTTAESGISYTYTLRALDAENNLVSYCNGGKSVTYVKAPTIYKIENTATGSKISWGKCSGASKYRVYYLQNRSWKALGNTTATSFTHNKLKSETKYTYTVRCLDSKGNFASGYDKNGTSNIFLNPPKISSLANINGGVEIKWNTLKDADSYRVYRKTKNTSWTRIGNTESNTFKDTNVQSGVAYTYTIRCIDKDGNFASGYDKNGTRNTFIAPPAISKVSKAGKGNLVKWKSVPKAAGYRLYRKTINTSWSRLADVCEGTSYTDTSAKKGNVYSYTLRCLDKNGNLISSYISNTKYYHNGALANGKITVNGQTYNFDKGLFRTGYQKINGKRYYYNSKGMVVKNTIVGSKREGWYYADKNGVCCESEEMRLAAEYMMTYCKGDTLDQKMKSGFLYMAKNFPYHRTYDHPKKASDLPALAIDLFKNKKGNCFRYAAAFACTARIAGYRSRVVIGDVLGSPHGWVEVLVNGEWLICDPDAQLPGYKVPDYKPYMMKKHYWTLNPHVKCEVTIENGKAVWK